MDGNGVNSNGRLSYSLYRGTVNKALRVSFVYKYDGDGVEYPTVKTTANGTKSVNSIGWSVSISEGFERNRIFIPGGKYWLFVNILHRTVDEIRKHMDELYPNMNEDEFQVNEKALEIYRQEKCLRAGGMCIEPDKWVDESGKCYVGLKLIGEYGECIVPMVDAIGMDCMMTTFDPNTFGLIVMNMFM